MPTCPNCRKPAVSTLKSLNLSPSLFFDDRFQCKHCAQSLAYVAPWHHHLLYFLICFTLLWIGIHDTMTNLEKIICQLAIIVVGFILLQKTKRLVTTQPLVSPEDSKTSKSDAEES